MWHEQSCHTMARIVSRNSMIAFRIVIVPEEGGVGHEKSCPTMVHRKLHFYMYCLDPWMRPRILSIHGETTAPVKVTVDIVSAEDGV